MTEVTIAPSILAADFGRLGEQVAALDGIPGVDRVHVDVMDGMFVPNISFGPVVLAAVRRNTRLPLDVHLMIERPDRYYAEFARAGAGALTVHVEACPHLYRDIAAIHELGLKAGVTLNPGTPVSALECVLGLVDRVLVMTVNPGFGGQAFIPAMVDKVRQVRAALVAIGSPADVAVDGGIAAGTARSVVSAGANVLVAGSALFGHLGGLAVAVEELRAAAGQS